MNKSIILECKNLSKVYLDGSAKIEVFNQLNLTVASAEVVAIVGNSGSGKSTLLHLLGGLDQPSSGQVFIAGKNIFELSEVARCELRNKNLGFVYQFHHLLPEFTALENVAMPLLIRGLDIKSIQEKTSHLLDLVGLGNRLQHKLHALSGGERQRVAIARALVNDPVCVLADEPTGNLDPRNADRVFQLFLDLQKTCQTSIIIVTHDMRLAQQTQRVLSLENGNLIS